VNHLPRTKSLIFGLEHVPVAGLDYHRKSLAGTDAALTTVGKAPVVPKRGVKFIVRVQPLPSGGLLSRDVAVWGTKTTFHPIVEMGVSQFWKCLQESGTAIAK